MILVDQVCLANLCYLGVPAIQEHQQGQQVLRIQGCLVLHLFPVCPRYLVSLLDHWGRQRLKILERQQARPVLQHLMDQVVQWHPADPHCQVFPMNLLVQQHRTLLVAQHFPAVQHFLSVLEVPVIQVSPVSLVVQKVRGFQGCLEIPHCPLVRLYRKCQPVRSAQYFQLVLGYRQDRLVPVDLHSLGSQLNP